MAVAAAALGQLLLAGGAGWAVDSALAAARRVLWRQGGAALGWVQSHMQARAQRLAVLRKRRPVRTEWQVRAQICGH
jgi:hypothetical protein